MIRKTAGQMMEHYSSGLAGRLHEDGGTGT